MILGEKIAYLRKQREWSQEELASRLGISRQSVSKWESGASIPDLDKVVRMSSLFGVSTDYLLKEEMEETAPQIPEGEDEGDPLRSVSLEEAGSYLELTRKSAAKMAFAVSWCILSPVCLILLGGLSEFGGERRLSENMAGGIGVTVLLVMVAIGVAVLIFHGMRFERYEYLEKEPFVLLYGVVGIVEKRKEEFANTFRKCITAGVVLCIIGVAPMMLAVGRDVEDMLLVSCVALLLCFVAVGVFLFVWAGSIEGSFDKLLQVGDYTPEKKSS